jgi:uncharacterized protein
MRAVQDDAAPVSPPGPLVQGNIPPADATQARPWLMAQAWHDLLFAHWPVPFDRLRALVPAPLTLDTFDDHAWLGIVAFRLSDIHLRGLPNAPGASHFPEVNLRTYVTLGGKPGVLFLSLHCPNRLAIALARPWFRLPYHYASVQFASADGARELSCRDPSGAALIARYGPAEAVARPSDPGSLLEFLTERYCYYSVATSGAVYRCDIQHRPWSLAPANAHIPCHTLAQVLGGDIQLDQPPLCHFAEHMDARIWPLRRVSAPNPPRRQACAPAVAIAQVQ